jgi:putative endonuclease
MLEHKKGIFPGSTKKYNVNKLVYFELFSNIYEAIHQKCLKKWKRDWKLNLIEESNPEWKDLYFEGFDL